MLENPQITVGAAIAEFLEHCGVKAAFGVISIHNMPILDAMFARGKVRFQKPILGAEEWECVVDEPIALGERVKVVSVEGSFLKVQKV